MTTMRRITQTIGPRKDERGAALLAVIGIGLVMTILVGTALSFSLAGYVKSNNDEQWSAAMAAAYSGVDEYESRLANDNTYQKYRNPASAFSAGGVGSLPTGADENPAFGVGAGGSWATVQGSGGEASFRYEVDNSQYGDTGVIRLRSTGRVGDATRSIVVNLKQLGFIDFLYFTNYEIQDPELTGKSVSTCVKYAWAGRPSNCGEIQFGKNDVINGPLHSNDRLLICSSVFKGAVTTASTSTPIYKNVGGSGCGTDPTFTLGGPTYSAVVGMPPTNTQMKREMRSDLTVEVPRPGCLYTGPTSIVFNGDGTMTVRSPWTKKTRIAGDPPTSGTTPTECGVIGTGTNQLGHSAGQKLTVPENNLIYVQDVPALTGDPNRWPTSGSGSRPDGYTSTTCTNGNGLGYPMSNEEVSAPATSYGCRKGDVFVKGTVHAAATIAAENYVYVVGDISYKDPLTDVLGLVGNNAVWVWNPVDDDEDSLLGDSGRRIDAAILSVAHTFQVQNYNKAGDRGVLTINGAIAQKFRGPVGTAGSPGTGYDKNYVYDPRFRYIAPPKFLSPVSTSYGVSVLVEVADAFNADGSAAP